MDDPSIIQIVIFIILLILSAFFSSAETAFTSVSRVRLTTLKEDGSKKAERALKIIDHPGKMLSTILIGNNIVNISATSLATAFTIRVFGNVFVGIVTALLTVFIIFFGEIIPKNAARAYSEKLSLAYAPVVSFLIVILKPIVFLVEKISAGILKIFKIDANFYNPMTENELKTYVDVSLEDGAIENEEREMILNVFEFGDSLAKDIMIPRTEMTMVEAGTGYGELKTLFADTLLSRIPVYEEDKDHVIGVVNLKDFFIASVKPGEEFSARSIMRDVYFTYETKKTDDLFNEMREMANNISIVLDEYGSCVGMITLEDLLEEIVGEIRDEYDEAEEENIRKIGNDAYSIAAFMKLDDINDALETKLFSEDFDSIGGLVIEHLTHIPKKGETVVLEDGTRLIATSVNKNRIIRVTLVAARN
ncbi:MAG TPA: hemolysin [Lachnospiraceae bacterium]|nr:hemolysin [Lachnospiraceae bacterium]